VTTEELESDGAEVCRRLFRWLEVDDCIKVDVSERFNVTKAILRQRRRFSGPLDRIMNGWRWQKLEKHVPPWIRRAAERATYRQIDRKATVIAPAIDYLLQRLEPTVRRLERLLGRDFPQWSTAPCGADAAQLQQQPIAGPVYESQIDCVW